MTDSLYLLAAAPDIRDYLVDAGLVDDAQAFGAYAQVHPAVFAFHPETMRLKIGQETSTCLVVSMGYIIAAHRPFSRYLANPGHGELRYIMDERF